MEAIAITMITVTIPPSTLAWKDDPCFVYSVV